MNILFVKSSIGSSLLPSFDMGIASMSAVLKEYKHNVNFFSFDNIGALKSLSVRIKNFKPKIVGFSVTASTFESSVEVAKYIKKKYPEILIILGGVHTTIFPDCIKVSKAIDAICRGEGEYALLYLISNLEKNDESYLKTRGFWIRDKQNNIIKNLPLLRINNINSLPFPDRSIFADEGILKYPREYDYGRFGLEFIFSRGCPFECSYCSNHALKRFYGPEFVRQKDPHLAILEIKEAMDHYRYDYFRFHDDTFTLDAKWLDKFLNEYKQIKVPFQCNIRADVCTKKTLEKMKEVGCEKVLIGVESGDDEIRTKILNKKITSSVLRRTFKWAKEVGLKSTAFVLIGLPGETPQKFINTIKFMSEIKCDEIQLYVFYPYPGTKLYNYCLSKKYIESNKRQPIVREREDTILNMPQFLRKDILFYYNDFFHLISLAKNKKPYFKFLFFLSTRPPSSNFYPLCKITLNFIYMFRLTIKRL